MRIDFNALTRKHHRRRTEFLDHGRSIDPAGRRQQGAIEYRRVPIACAKINRPAGPGSGVGRAPRKPRHLRPFNQTEAGDAEIDQLDLLLTGVIIAEGPAMRRIEGTDQSGKE